MNRPPAAPEPVVVQRQQEVTDFCARAREEGRFAFDTEFVMEDRFEAEVCLVQLATQHAIALVDPFLELDLRPIWEMVCDEQVETVVHAGHEDLAVCFREVGAVPRRLFDVQIAAGFVGLDYPLSLQKLVQALMHIRLHKSKTLTDWRKRPLSKEQLRYAAEDVSYLLASRKKLHERLTARGRLEWAEEEFRHFEDRSLYDRDEEDKLRRVKGMSSLKGKELTIARRLLAWREELARQLNRPARVVVKDHLLVEIAKHGISNHAELRDLRGLNMSDRNVHALAAEVQLAQTLPAENLPLAKAHDFEDPRESVLIALATAVVRGYCLDSDLAYGLVATKKSLRDLIRHRTADEPTNPEEVELLNGWRAETVGALLDDVLAGRRTLHVETINGEAHVRVGERARQGRD